MGDLINDSFQNLQIPAAVFSAADIWSINDTQIKANTSTADSKPPEDLVFFCLPGYDPPQTPTSTGPQADSATKTIDTTGLQTLEKTATQPGYGTINDCLDGLDHKNYKERERAQTSLETFMYESVDNFTQVVDAIEKKGNNLSEEQRSRWTKLLHHPFVGRMDLKGFSDDPAPVSVQDVESFISNPEKLAKRVDLLKRISDPKFLEALQRTSIREQHDLNAEFKLLSQLKSDVDKNLETGENKMPESLKRAMILEISKRGGSPNAKEYLDRILKESPESIFRYIPNPMSVRLDELAFNYLKEGGDMNSLLELREKLEKGDIKPKKYETDIDVPSDELSHWNTKTLTKLRDSEPIATMVQAAMGAAKQMPVGGGMAGGGPRAGDRQDAIGGRAPGGDKGGPSAPPANDQPPSPPSPEDAIR